jgi:hypothetical protein
MAQSKPVRHAAGRLPRHNQTAHGGQFGIALPAPVHGGLTAAGHSLAGESICVFASEEHMLVKSFVVAMAADIAR